MVKVRNHLRWIGIAAILVVMAGVIVLAQDKPLPVSPVTTTTTPGQLRLIVDCPDNGTAVTVPGTTISGIEYHGYNGPGVDGRCVTTFVPKTTFFDDVFVPGNDDPCGFVGNTSGSLVVNCEFPHNWEKVSEKALIGYTNTNTAAPGPIYGHEDGFAATFINNKILGGAIRFRDGVWEWRNNIIVINALYGMDFMDVKANIIDNDFIAIEQMPKGAPYWMQRNKDGTIHPCGIRICGNVNGQQTATPLKSRLFFTKNRLHTFKTLDDFEAWRAGKVIQHTIVDADGPMLVRAFPTAASAKAGWTAYQPMGQGIPKEVFLKTPN